ncbi:Ketosteroid isomerase-related protein [Granulicella rosea]|uniref:Ketosteroid isomerase-related protein n=1 Tax=Granulicella rosea TaxID=474952 RepID=A0A239K0E5_9BACT|nr:nuclear transport factor 2 family protein [Granulicella rosea]SNT11510.1 Ketosteroid isomerase-related protein [Granulicella rosea]
MSRTMSASEYAVEQFFRALSDRDISIAPPVLSEEVNLTIPYALAGGTDPERVFKRKDAVLGYLGMVLENFTRSVITDRQTFLTDDGRTVFVEGRGDLIRKSNGEPYRNLYVFRFTISDGHITDIREYGNPVIYAKALGLQIG